VLRQLSAGRGARGLSDWNMHVLLYVVSISSVYGLDYLVNYAELIETVFQAPIAGRGARGVRSGQGEGSDRPCLKSNNPTFKILQPNS
jgi:hypothetical protein